MSDSTERLIDYWHTALMDTSHQTMMGSNSLVTDSISKQTSRGIMSYFTSTPKLVTSQKRALSTPEDLRPDKYHKESSMTDEELRIENSSTASAICNDISTTMESFKTSLISSVDKYKEELLLHITSLKDRVGLAETSLSSQDKRIEDLENENTEIRKRNVVLEGRLTRNETLIEKIQEELEILQINSMKNNLLIYNIPENDQEDPFTTTSEFLKQEMNLDGRISIRDIVKCHRLGQRQTDQKYPRPILAQLDPRSTDLVMSNAYKLKGKPYRISVQLPKQVEERRKLLLPLFKEARANKKRTSWNRDRLRVDGVEHKLPKPVITDVNTDTVAETLKMKVKRAQPKTVSNNTFQASITNVNNINDVIPALHAVFMDHRCARASKNMYAYRIRAGDRMLEYYDDDGEFGAGRRILQELKKNNRSNVILCVTRWCGGNLGPARFNHITDVAEQALKL